MSKKTNSIDSIYDGVCGPTTVKLAPRRHRPSGTIFQSNHTREEENIYTRPKTRSPRPLDSWIKAHLPSRERTALYIGIQLNIRLEIGTTGNVYAGMEDPRVRTPGELDRPFRVIFKFQTEWTDAHAPSRAQFSLERTSRLIRGCRPASDLYMNIVYREGDYFVRSPSCMLARSVAHIIMYHAAIPRLQGPMDPTWHPTSSWSIKIALLRVCKVTFQEWVYP
jgi:hypothetical protein